MTSSTPSERPYDRSADRTVDLGTVPERALLAHLTLDRDLPHASAESVEETNLEELGGLVHAAGAVVVGQVTQRRPRPHPATLFGKGKVEEISHLVHELKADIVVVDCDLTPAQGRNLEKALGVRVIDRTELILAIFDRRAQTRQARLQVELAQLRYQLPRLRGMWTHLERTAGNVNMRGPGETQLETDRRLAESRVTQLERQLDEIRRQKEVESVGRREFELGALVGYTNVGKSALLNALSRPAGRRVLEADMLFATLGSATRKVELGGGLSILLSDTVGFVRKLPHHLVECFHTTLAEVQHADFLLHIADANDPELEQKITAVQRVLGELEVRETPTILVLNQCDRLAEGDAEALLRQYPEALLTSAVTGAGIDTLRERIRSLLESDAEEVEFTLEGRSADTGRVLADVARHGRVLHKEWVSPEGDGTRPQLRVRARLGRRWLEQIGIKADAVRS